MPKIDPAWKRSASRVAAGGIVAWLALCGCGGAGTHEHSPCAGIQCNGHGTCAVEAGVATCSCETGYHADGLSCLLDQGTALMGWQLDETNTGLAGAGVDRGSLPLYQPPANQVQYGTWVVPAGTSVQDVRIEVGGIDLSAGDITLQRCWFHPSTIGSGMPFIGGLGASLNTIRDSDIDGTGIALNGDGTNPACGSIAISTARARIERCNIFGFGSGVALTGQDESSLTGTYIHDLVQGEWFAGSGTSHQDGFTTRSFGGTSLAVRNNHILVNPPTKIATGPLFLQATWGDSFFDNVDIEGNLLEGYGYCLALEKDNGGYGTNLRVINNRFDSWSGWTTYVQSGPGWAEWRENYQNDPARTDNQGAPVEEPMTGASSTLSAPSGLQVTPVSGSSLRLSWTDSSTTELGFRIGRSSDGVVFTSIDMAAADATSYLDAGLSAGTTYYYRVAAASGAGMSGYSNVASAATSSP